MWKNNLIRKMKDKVNFKIHDVLAKQTIAIHIFINISRCKDKKAMKFNLLIEYKMRNIFLEKSYTRFGGETIP